jgi:FdhE protein
MNAVIETPTQAPIPTAGTPPAVIVPAMDVFAARAARFGQLAESHALGDWLRFLGALSQAQHQCLHKAPEPPFRDARLQSRAREHGMPPLPAQTWQRDPAWRAILRCVCEDLHPAAPASLRPALDALNDRPAAEIEALADRVLRTELYGPDAALLPIVAAALQVYWTRMAIGLGDAGIPPLDVPGVCPCCGFLPVASVVKMAGVGDNAVANVRYLHCALCNTEWNLVRVKCASCDSTEGIGYRHLEGAGLRNPDAVRAETCESCKSYLKIVYQEKGALDPVADDLASLALDILMDEAGYGRSGPNLLLVPGDA